MPKIRPFDTAEYLDSPEMIAVYLTESFESGDPASIDLAIRAVERAQQPPNRLDGSTPKPAGTNRRSAKLKRTGPHQ
jgi:hypothetical protein